MNLRRALITWALLFVIAFANGALRELTYARRMSLLAAHQLSCFTGISALALAIWTVNRRWPFRSYGQAWRTGFLWMALTTGWEFVFGHFVMGHTWGRLLADYAIWQGRLWILVLISIVLLPPLVFRLDLHKRSTSGNMV